MNRYFCYDGCEYDFYETLDEAKSCAERAVEYYRSDAWANGEWEEVVSQIFVGQVVEAVIGEESLSEDGETFVEYRLANVQEVESSGVGDKP